MSAREESARASIISNAVGHWAAPVAMLPAGCALISFVCVPSHMQVKKALTGPRCTTSFTSLAIACQTCIKNLTAIEAGGRHLWGQERDAHYHANQAILLQRWKPVTCGGTPSHVDVTMLSISQMLLCL